MNLTAICIVPGCDRHSPPPDPFCHVHSDPAEAVRAAYRQGWEDREGDFMLSVERLGAPADPLVGIAAALLAALDMEHGSMCPANTCTCDLTETVTILADSLRAALAARTGHREPPP